MELISYDPTEAAVSALQWVLRRGQKVAPRGMATRERLDVSIKVLEPHRLPLHMPGRKLSPFIAAVEALQLVGQATRPDLAAAGSPGLARFRDDQVFWGGYGQRIHGHLGPLVRLLTVDEYTRQAVLTIHQSSLDLGRSKRDIPCTLTVQFLLREQLRMRVSMRSNDAWLGLPYDLFQFSSLHGALAAALDVEQGPYTHIVGSMHLYESDVQAVEEFLSHTAIGPASSDVAPAQALWRSDSINEISATARRILDGTPVHPLTSHEQWLITAMEKVHGQNDD